MVPGEMGCSDLLIVEAQFVREGKKQIVSNYDSIFWPDKARIGVRTPGS